MIKSKIGLAAVVLGSAMAVLTPTVASAYDRDDYYRHDDRRDRERREHERREREERRERLERERARERYYYNNRGYGNGFYSQPQPRGYYDRYGYWHAY